MNERPSPAPEPYVTIEMGGPNVVIRSTSSIDHAYTNSLVNAVNAAADADVTVVLDPDPIRIDDDFAAYHHEPSLDCVGRGDCRPAPVDVVATGVLRVPAESTVWFVDLVGGRFCRSDRHVDHRFLPPDAWTPVVAICLTPTRLIARTVRHGLISAPRAVRSNDQQLPVGAR